MTTGRISIVSKRDAIVDRVLLIFLNNLPQLLPQVSRLTLLSKAKEIMGGRTNDETNMSNAAGNDRPGE